MKKFLTLFLLISGIHLFLLILDQDYWAAYTKPLLIPVLALAVFKSPILYGKGLLILALILSWIGDVLLIFADRHELYFIFGLGSFLLAHVFYVILFLKHATMQKLKLFWFAIGLVLVSAYLGIFLTILIPKLGDLTIPVVIYAFIISIMLLSTVRALLTWQNKYSLLVFLGALCFVISDSLLAINKFYEQLPQASLLIMLTYLAAQFLITYGMLKVNR